MFSECCSEWRYGKHASVCPFATPHLTVEREYNYGMIYILKKKWKAVSYHYIEMCSFVVISFLQWWSSYFRIIFSKTTLQYPFNNIFLLSILNTFESKISLERDFQAKLSVGNSQFVKIFHILCLSISHDTYNL